MHMHMHKVSGLQMFGFDLYILSQNHGGSTTVRLLRLGWKTGVYSLIGSNLKMAGCGIWL